MSVEAIVPGDEERAEEEEEITPEEARRRFTAIIRSQPEILLCLIEELLEEMKLDSVEFMRRAIGRWLA